MADNHLVPDEELASILVSAFLENNLILPDDADRVKKLIASGKIGEDDWSTFALKTIIRSTDG